MALFRWQSSAYPSEGNRHGARRRIGVAERLSPTLGARNPAQILVRVENLTRRDRSVLVDDVAEGSGGAGCDECIVTSYSKNHLALKNFLRSKEPSTCKPIVGKSALFKMLLVDRGCRLVCVEHVWREWRMLKAVVTE
tara:strand:- start:14 stop:427 length:414 start_codon:yes stop_codon:yes gene_type:complete